MRAWDTIEPSDTCGPDAFLSRAARADTSAEWLPLIDLHDWAMRNPPEREWALQGWIPARQATYLTGPGSAGKSLLSQQLCTCIAMGLPFMGMPTTSTVSVYVTCEDDADELERRQFAICAALGVDRADLPGRLHLVSLQGAIDNELIHFDEKGGMKPSPTYERLEATARGVSAGFVALDNVAHLTAEEIQRSKVAGFVNLLNRLALRIDGAVLFLGHPNKAGDAFSGSTAWENQVRSRLYLETPGADDDCGAVDPDVRVLSRQKSNYARNGEQLRFRWHNWAFVNEADIPADSRAEMALSAQANADNIIFLNCLRERARQGEGRLVGPSPGPNYAPRQFEGMPQAKGLRAPRLRAAMDRLFGLGLIEAHTYRNTAKGRDVTIIREASGTASPNPELPPRTAPEHHSRTTPDYPPEPPRAHTVDTTYLGAALQGPAPTSGSMTVPHAKASHEPLPECDPYSTGEAA